LCTIGATGICHSVTVIINLRRDKLQYQTSTKYPRLTVDSTPVEKGASGTGWDVVRLMEIAVRGAFCHALPHEVLAEIFLCYAETAELLYPTPKLPPPLLLGQICSIWRYVVHDTPKLWTGFSLEFVGEEGYEGKVDHISFAKAWFERARPYPLRVSLRVNTFNKKFSRMLDAILSSADRIQYLHLHLPYPHYWPLVHVAAGSMALLESVSLSVGFSDSQQLVRWVRRITAFVAAPRLRSVTLFSPSPWGLFESDLPMPWSQLTTLYLHESATLLYACLDVLSKCTNLVNCMLNIDATAVEGIQPHVPIVILPCLGKLHLLFVEPGDFSPFFQHLNLPALKDLTIETIYGYRWSHQSFTEFALRSSLDSERLRFGYVNIRSDELLLLLTCMQSLVELDIEHSQCVDNSLFGALCYREMDDHHLVPRLKTLLISHASGHHIDDILIASMIESRWWTDNRPCMISRLERVNVIFGDRKMFLWVRRRLRRCRREGLTVNVD